MFMVDYLVATALLCAPNKEPIPVPMTYDFYQVQSGLYTLPRHWGILKPPEQYKELRQILQHLAMSMEVMDAREPRYLLCHENNFESDLEMLRRRVKRLKDAPPLFSCKRFPPREIVDDWLKKNREYRKMLEKRREIDRTNDSWYQEALRDLEWRYEVWSTIKDTRCKHYYVTYRRGALKKVREMMGSAAYYNGDYPAPLPESELYR